MNHLGPILFATLLSACAASSRAPAPAAPVTSGATAPATPARAAPPNVTVDRLVPADGDLQALLRAEVARASALGLAPFVEFYAPWCKPCQHIEQYAKDPRMIDAYRGTYLVRLDLDQWRDRLDRKVYPVANIPVFYPLDRDGRPTGPLLTSEAWGPSVPEEMAPKLKAFFDANGARGTP